MQNVEISLLFFICQQCRTANPAHPTAMFCHALVCPQKAIVVCISIFYIPKYFEILVSKKYRKDCQMFEIFNLIFRDTYHEVSFSSF